LRFLFTDRLVELNPNQRIVAVKTVSVMDEYLTEHYSYRPRMPATLLLECLAQAGGWLNLASRGFSIRMVLALMEGVRVFRQVKPGDTLTLEVRMLYAHSDGATMQGDARINSDRIATVDRFVFANERVDDEQFVKEQRARFDYLFAGFQL
jgi:3-hydroxyacyl-[acyl-carrier-protein] dehydratase